MKTKKLLFALSFLFLVGCSGQQDDPQSAADEKAAVYKVKVVKSYPHDSNAFTQGLIFHDGFLYESTGLRGESTLRKVNLDTGKVLKKVPLDSVLFGEGLAMWKDRLVQLTWHAGRAFVYDRETFKLLNTMKYNGEGWGLTADKNGFIMSDGTADLRFLDPKTFKEVKRVRVTDRGRPVKMLNELEYINGEIFANVWMKDRIARIDPKTGKVTAWLDLSNLVPAEHRGSESAVLNGIAYDAEQDRLFVTGKLWSTLYEIKIGDKK